MKRIKMKRKDRIKMNTRRKCNIKKEKYRILRITICTQD
jgi:hypothetical protein